MIRTATELTRIKAILGSGSQSPQTMYVKIAINNSTVIKYISQN